ncbi:MAG: thioredoxin [Candidatus Pacearchaeota archaeon]
MKEIEEKDFEDVLKKSKQKTILIDFYADWCMPCRILKPIIESIEKEFEDKNIEFLKINIDKNRNLALAFNILSIPTIILLRNGKEISRIVGALPKEEIIYWINKNLKASGGI